MPVTKKEQVVFIDRFFVPADSKEEFFKRMAINRNFIKELPGFLGDEVYQRLDENGNLVCITVAKWQNETFLEDAKKAVQQLYKKEGFNPAEMFQRMGITVDRAVYT